MSQETLAAMRKAVIDGDVDQARALAESAVERGDDLLRAIDGGFAAGIRKVGELWEDGEYFLPELVQGAEAMKAAMDVLNPALAARNAATEPKAKVVIGTVHGDLHDIGKTLVATMLEANGYEVHDLGNDVPVAAFIAKATEVGARIVAASALLTTTMVAQKQLVEATRGATGLAGAKVLVGGSATTAEWAASIGAAFAENAQQAVAAAEQLIS